MSVFHSLIHTASRTLMLIMAALLASNSPARAEPRESTLARIREFNPWLSPDDPLQLPLKLHSLVRDEYTFFRGTVDLYYDWCRDNCRDWLKSDDVLLLHGDVHLGNIGTYRSVSGNRFAVVDLDETFSGPYHLDVLRGLISLRFAASDNRIELSRADRTALIDRFLEAYTEGLSGRLTSDDLEDRNPLVKSLLNEARDTSAAEYAGKFCTGKPLSRFRPTRQKKGRVADIMTPVEKKTRDAIAAAIRTLLTKDNVGFNAVPIKPHVEANDILDVVEWCRIDSGGSQGVKKYLVLVAPNAAWENAPLILQLKEEPIPAAARAGLITAPRITDRAERVANQYLLLIDPLPWLTGHVEVNGRGFLVRTKDPFSEEPEPEDFETRDALMNGAQLLGETLGSAHRAGLRVLKGYARIPNIARQTKMLAGEFDARSNAAMEHLKEGYMNLKQDSEAQQLVERARRRIAEAQGAGP